MKSKRRCNGIKILLVFAFCVCGILCSTVKVEAAKNYKKTYGNLLKKKTVTVTTEYGYDITLKANYFTLVDINRNGVKELIVSEDKYADYIYVFTLKRGKAKYIGNMLNKYYNGVRYSKKYKGLVIATGGSGASGTSIYQIKNNRLVEKYAFMVEHNMTDEYYFNGKKVSAKSYNTKKKKYLKSSTIKEAKMYKNTKSNRNKRLK